MSISCGKEYIRKAVLAGMMDDIHVSKSDADNKRYIIYELVS